MRLGKGIYGEFLALCKAKEGLPQASWKGFYSLQEAEDCLFPHLMPSEKIIVEAEQGSPMEIMEEEYVHTPRGINLILQQQHLAEAKIREVKSDFDELLDLSGTLSRINKSLQMNVTWTWNLQKIR